MASDGHDMGNQYFRDPKKKDGKKDSNFRPNKASGRNSKSRDAAASGNRNRGASRDNGAKSDQGGGRSANHGWNDIIHANVNDISWYARSPELLMDAASISWFAPTGQKMHTLSGAITPGQDCPTTMPSIPGIMAFRTAMIPGYAQDNTAALNVAARDIYGDIRSTNSGGKNYDPANLMMYLLALDSAYSMLAWLRRVHKELCVTSFYNRYLPEINVRSEGLDYEDLIGHISDLRWFINAMQVKLGTLAIPASLPIFVRHMYLMSNLFSDAPNQKGQIYKFVPDGYWFYDDTEVPAKLQYTKLIETTPMTFDFIKIIFTDMINALCQSEDIGVMSGDIIRYYGEGNLFKMEPLLPEEIIVPVFNEEMLDQIQNMNIINADLVGYADGESIPFTIEEDPSYTGPASGALLCKPCFYDPLHRSVPHVWETKRVFTVENADPNPPQTMILSRLAVGAIPATTADEPYRLINCCGTEIVTQAIVWYFNETDGVLRPDSVQIYGTYNSVGYTAATLYRVLVINAFMRMFDRHPAAFIVSATADPNYLELVDYNLELSNYTTCDNNVLRKMHDAAILSEFGVPVVGSRANNLK